MVVLEVIAEIDDAASGGVADDSRQLVGCAAIGLNGIASEGGVPHLPTYADGNGS